MRFNPASGYLTFPKSVHLWASITHPYETMSMSLFDRVAASLVQEVQDKRFLAYLATGTKTVEADFPIDGEVFRAIMNGDLVDLAPPHVTVPASGVVVFRETDVIKAAEIARTFPSVRVPIGEAIAWIATRDPKAVAAARTQPTEPEGGDYDPNPDSLEKLERAIEAGHIAAFGRPFAGEYLRPIQPIPALQWNRSKGLRICFGNFSNLPDDFYATAAPMSPAEFYHLEVCRSELLREFTCPKKHLGSMPPELEVETSMHPPNPLHKLIRKIADELNPEDKAPEQSASVLRESINKELLTRTKQRRSDSTIKEALKGTRHLKAAKRKQTKADGEGSADGQ